jgi:hypothetical protein
MNIFSTPDEAHPIRTSVRRAGAPHDSWLNGGDAVLRFALLTLVEQCSLMVKVGQVQSTSLLNH